MKCQLDGRIGDETSAAKVESQLQMCGLELCNLTNGATPHWRHWLNNYDTLVVCIPQLPRNRRPLLH